MSRFRRLQLALAINGAITVLQIVAGLAAGSVGLLADAFHNGSDVIALAVSLAALRLTARPATTTHSFGYHRATILAAQANAALLLVVTGVLGVEAVRRLSNPGDVDGAVVAVAAALGVVGNFAAARLLHDRAHGHDLNMRSAMLHLLGDAFVSVGVLVSGLVIAFTSGWERLDPAITLVLGAFITWRAVALLRQASVVLLEAAPAGLDMDMVTEALRLVHGVESVHDVHAWSLSSDLAALSAHLVLDGHPTLEEAQVVGARAKTVLAERYAITHATLELECESCVEDPGTACAVVSAAPTPSALDHNH